MDIVTVGDSMDIVTVGDSTHNYLCSTAEL